MHTIQSLIGRWLGRRPKTSLIVGILQDPASAETLLNNLSEADFDLSGVSVVMSDVKARDAIARDAGPLKGCAPADAAARLATLGILQPTAQRCGDAVAAGKAVVAMTVPAESAAAAAEMLKDHSAELVRE